MLSEIDENNCCDLSNKIDHENRPNADDCLIDLNHIIAKWPSKNNDGTNNNTLTDVTITVGRGQLLVVVGHVGAGKV